MLYSNHNNEKVYNCIVVITLESYIIGHSSWLVFIQVLFLKTSFVLKILLFFSRCTYRYSVEL